MTHSKTMNGALVIGLISPLGAASLLINGSFEETVQTGGGNHLDAIVSNWTITNRINLVVATPGYNAGPDLAADGLQYLDLVGTGTIRQSFTVAADSPVIFGGSFSRREFSNTMTNSISIYDSLGGLVMAAPSIPFQASDSQETWFPTSATISNLPAGTYDFEIAVGGDLNVDDVFVNTIPEPSAVLLSVLGGTCLLGRRKRS